jgi:hypothetical protein
MNQIEEIEVDPIGDLRRALNQEMFDREQFHKLTQIVKILPELIDVAKENK